MNSAHGRVPAHETAKAKAFGVISIALGGIGGRPGKDGLATTAFPSGIGAIPIEVTENQCPLYFKRKEYLTDSAPAPANGAADFRRQSRSPTARKRPSPFPPQPSTASKTRRKGRDGGGSGVKGVARLGTGKAIPDKGIHVIPTGDSLVVELPGGGGFGDPKSRTRALVEADVKAGTRERGIRKKRLLLGSLIKASLSGKKFHVVEVK